MVVYRTYTEDCTHDPLASGRGFLHAENRTAIRYTCWLHDGLQRTRDGWNWVPNVIPGK